MIPVKLIEDVAPRLTFLDEFATRCPVPNYFPSTPSSLSRGGADSPLSEEGYHEIDSIATDSPPYRMSMLALKGRCLAVCLYSNSILQESKKRSFSTWNAWVRRSEYSRRIRQSVLIVLKKKWKSSLQVAVRCWQIFTSAAVGLRHKRRSLARRSMMNLYTRIFAVWRKETSTFDMDSSDQKICCNEDSVQPDRNEHLRRAKILGTNSQQKSNRRFTKMPLKYILKYGATLSRIVRVWAEFAQRQRVDIYNQLRCQNLGVLYYAVCRWAFKIHQAKTIVWVHRVRATKIFKKWILSEWRGLLPNWIVPKGCSHPVSSTFNALGAYQRQPNVAVIFVSNSYESGLMRLGQRKNRTMQRALDSWLRSLDLLHSIKLAARQARASLARCCVRAWSSLVETCWSHRVFITARTTGRREDLLACAADRLLRAAVAKWRRRCELAHLLCMSSPPHGAAAALARAQERALRAALDIWGGARGEAAAAVQRTRHTGRLAHHALERYCGRLLGRVLRRLRQRVEPAGPRAAVPGGQRRHGGAGGADPRRAGARRLAGRGGRVGRGGVLRVLLPRAGPGHRPRAGRRRGGGPLRLGLPRRRRPPPRDDGPLRPAPQGGRRPARGVPAVGGGILPLLRRPRLHPAGPHLQGLGAGWAAPPLPPTSAVQLGGGRTVAG